MESGIGAVLGILAVGVVVGIIWRFASRRRELPCPAWLHWCVELDNPFTETNRAAFIIEHLGLKEGMVVLDAGSGPGRLTVPAAERVGPTGVVVALDVQPGMLDHARQKVAALGLGNVQFLNAGIGDGRLPHNHFDRALLVTVLGEITNPKAAMCEVFNALKPGGILSVTEVIFDPHFQGKDAVTALARQAGFLVKQHWGHKLAFVLHLQKPEAGNSRTVTLVTEGVQQRNVATVLLRELKDMDSTPDMRSKTAHLRNT